MNVKKNYSKMKIVAHGLTTSQMLKQMAMLTEFIKSLTQVSSRFTWTNTFLLKIVMQPF